jgi:hypothetical protein
MTKIVTLIPVCRIGGELESTRQELAKFQQKVEDLQQVQQHHCILSFKNSIIAMQKGPKPAAKQGWLRTHVPPFWRRTIVTACKCFCCKKILRKSNPLFFAKPSRINHHTEQR